MNKEDLLNKINQLDIEVSENYPHDYVINRDEVISLIMGVNESDSLNEEDAPPFDKDKLTKIAKKLDMEIVFDPTKPAGVYDESDGSFTTYEDLFKDILKDKTIIKYQVEWKHLQADIHNKHGIFDTFEEAIDSIYEWWETNNFTPPYIRRWTEDGVTTIDYGFHHMFYYIVECLI